MSTVLMVCTKQDMVENDRPNTRHEKKGRKLDTQRQALSLLRASVEENTSAICQQHLTHVHTWLKYIQRFVRAASGFASYTHLSYHRPINKSRESLQPQTGGRVWAITASKKQGAGTKLLCTNNTAIMIVYLRTHTDQDATLQTQRWCPPARPPRSNSLTLSANQRLYDQSQHVT